MDEDIGNNPNIIFPEYTESWFGPSQVSPESDLVQRRKSDLQVSYFHRVAYFLLKYSKIGIFLSIIPSVSDSFLSYENYRIS